MAYEISGFKFSIPAAADLSALQYHFVKLDNAAGVIAVAADTDIPCGVLQNAPVSGRTAEIMVSGVTKIKTAGALATAKIIGPDGTGLAEEHVAGTNTTKYVCGQIILATGGANGIGTALINCFNPHRAA